VRAQVVPRALERAVGGRDAHRQGGGGVVSRPVQDIAHHEHGLLARRQVPDRCE
jgi:hypothetical protein